jgi:diguanylate cyclase (GGDEF)-like protein
MHDGPAAADEAKILLIEDSVPDAQLIKALLGTRGGYAVTTVTKLARGLTQLCREKFDLVLLDLTLPDAAGVDGVARVHRAAPNIPIVALSSIDDDQLALSVLREGAQDWLVKSQVDCALLMRVIRYASERHRLLAEVQSLALTDTLTGLFNRRGFVTIAEEQLKLARRSGYSLALAFVDLDGMKRINDELGHEVGDQALVATARILRATFRSSDVLARLGGDEFIVLAIAAGPAVSNRIRKQLVQSLAEHNQVQGAVPLSFSIGFTHYTPVTEGQQSTIEELMVEADKMMYLEKQASRSSRTYQENLAKQVAGEASAMPETA